MAASASLNLQALPVWSVWLGAILGTAFFSYALFHMMPPLLRKRQPGWSVVLALLLFFAVAGFSNNYRTILWFGGTGFFVLSFPLLWMGKLPADMPSARDPRVCQHPRYKEIVRRGRITGATMVILVIIQVTLSAIYVRG